MNRIHNLLMSSLNAHLVLFLSLHGWGIFCIASQGCTYSKKTLYCDFQLWNPPLQDKDVEDPVHDLNVTNINGTIPAGAFSGLKDPLISTLTYMRFFCKPGGYIRLYRDIFTPNLHWVINFRINQCYIQNGLSSRLVENLKSLKYFTIDGTGSAIEGSVAHDALTGLTNLQILAFGAAVKNGKLPSGFFDGLQNLTLIRLKYSELHCVRPNSFNGLVNLKTIDLAGNNLSALPNGLFDELSSVIEIGLADNPWDCSCELTWLLDWIDVTDGGVCAQPLSMHGKGLKEALSALKCESTTPADLSKSICLETEITETQTYPFNTFEALSTTNQAKITMFPTSKRLVTRTGPATYSQRDFRDSIATYTKSFGTSLTVEFTHTTTTICTSTTLASLASLKETRIQSTNQFSNELRDIALGLALGTSPAFLVVAIVIYRSYCRNTRFQSVNQVSNGEETRRNPESQRTARPTDQVQI